MLETSNGRIYLRAEVEYFDNLTVPEVILNKRGKMYQDIILEEDQEYDKDEEGNDITREEVVNPKMGEYLGWYAPTKGTMTWWKAGYPTDEDGNELDPIEGEVYPPIRTTKENAKYGIIGVPNFSQNELVTLINIGLQVATPGFIFLMNAGEVRKYIETGILPE